MANPRNLANIAPAITRITGGVQNKTLTIFSPDSANEPTITNISTGSSGNTLKLMAGVNVRGGQIDICAGEAASNPGTLLFRTGTGGGQGEQSERMRIDAAGNVGIGISSLSGILHVNGVQDGVAYKNVRLSYNGSYYLEINEQAIRSFNNPLIFGTGTSGTERARINASGALSIGTTGADGSRLTTSSTANDNNVYFARNTGTTAPTTYPVVISGGSGGSNTASYAGLSIVGFNGVGNSSSARIGVGVPASYVYHDTAFVSLYGGGLWQNGCFHWSTTGTTTFHGADYNGCEFYNHLSDNQQAFTFYSSRTNFGASLIYARCATTTTNGTYNLIYAANGNGTGQFAVRDNGNCVNTNNSYGSISDIKLKQDIVDASTQWDDIKNLRIRKFRWKSEVAEDANAKPYLGLIAQEAELVSPGLIEETDDYEEFEEDSIGDDGDVVLKEDGTPHKKRIRRELGTTTKTVKYSILYMKAIKALQEAMDRIEQLEAKMNALENKGN